MHLNEGLINKQLQMKISVLENALTQMIDMHSQLFSEVETLKRTVNQLSRNSNNNNTSSETQNPEEDTDMDLDISQVQRILKQQNAGPSSLGRRA